MMKEKELRALFALNGHCGYNAETKAEFRRLAMKFLRELRKAMGVEAEVRYNAGGIAVSGDATLHTENLYLTFNADRIANNGSILYRRCKGYKDYGTGTDSPNHYVTFEAVASYGIEWMAGKMKEFLASECRANNMRCEVHGFTTTV
jgi:hypothetical protein